MKSRPALGLRGRLAISIALIMLAALAVTYAAVYRGTGSELRDRTEKDLEREVETLSTELSTGKAQTPDDLTIKSEKLAGLAGFGTSSQVVSITVRGGGTATNQPDLLGLSKSGDDASSDGNSGEDGEHSGSGSDDGHEHEVGARSLLDAPDGYSSIDVDDVGEVRVLTRSFALANGNQATIRVGEPLAPVDRALEGFKDSFLVVGLITLLLAAAAGWLLASFSTKPMRRMSEVAEGVDGGDLTSRMPISETKNDEVRKLAESFNQMLDRIEATFTRQKEFVADASHDLRTPLTIIKGQIAVLSRQADPTAADVERVSGIVETATQRMERLVDDLLLLARAESDDPPTLEKIDLSLLISAEVEAFRETDDRQFELGGLSGREVLVDREKIARALSNLIANAVAHTKPDGRILVSASTEPGRMVIAVEDDGPGVPIEMRERIFSRFARLDESRSSSEGGSGLGLAIVRAIVESHNGSVSCEESKLGGARFVIRLPIAA